MCAHLCQRVRECREPLKPPPPNFFRDANKDKNDESEAKR